MNRKYLITLSIIITIITIVGLSYAYFTANITGAESETTIIVEAGRMEITYVSDTGNININNIVPGYEVTKTFRVIGNNSTELSMGYQLNLIIENNTFSSNALAYSLTGTKSGTGTLVQQVTNKPISGIKTIKMGEGLFDPLSNAETHTYNLKISFPNKNEDQNEDMGKTFKAYVTVTRIMTILDSTPPGTLVAAVATNYPNITDESSIDFRNGVPITANMLVKTTDYDGEETYIFRGVTDVVNNWVKFGTNSSNQDLYWRIIRINSDGSIRMIYNGPSTATSGSTTHIGTSAFNSSDTDYKYAGYTYLENGIEVDSTIKTYLESWYNNNIGNKPNLVSKIDEQGKFCNDKRPAVQNPANVFLSTERNSLLSTNLSPTGPSISCAEGISSYGVKDLYSLPVGLITLDEAIIAGSTPYDSHLPISDYCWIYNNLDYFTLTPTVTSFNSQNVVGVYYIRYNGQFNSASVISTTDYVRPVINLLPGTMISGGDGSSSTPYIVA